MSEIKIKDPFILENVLDEDTLRRLQRYAMKMWSESQVYDESFGRHQFANTEALKVVHEMLTNVAREYFESDTLKPTWCLLGIYEGKEAKLWKHKDDNACTYHIDLCVFQKEGWDLWAEGKPYMLKENDALLMYGNDQEHWREAFPNPETNLVCNAFFFFCEPDHWYFTEGPDYLYTHIRANSNRNFNKTIFINIPSYKDPEIWMTIDNFLKNARNPNRVYFGVTNQPEDIEKENNIYLNYDKSKVKVDILKPGSIVGCQPARKNSHKFYDNQDYYLNMDSHMRSIENWDELIINEFEDIELRRGKSVITGYVNDYLLDENNNETLKISTPWVYHMSQDNLNNFKNTGIVQMVPVHSEHTQEVESPYVSGHFFFTRSEYVNKVNFIDEIAFTEEEIFMALRFFTAGYNIYIPKKTYVLHRYGRPNRKLFWEDFPEKFFKADEFSKNFFNNIVSNNIIDDQKGLFSDRSLNDFEKYSGINFNSREVTGKLLL